MHIYSVMWMDGLARKYTGKVLTQKEKTDITPVNFSQLAEHMLNPHHGQHNGLIRPNLWCQGTEGACDCIKVPNKVEASNVVDRTPCGSGSIRSRGQCLKYGSGH